MSQGGQGLEVYQLAQAYPAAAAAARVERALGKRVAGIERDRVSGSHAVFFVTLAGGPECVLRAATHPEHDLARELWAMEQCRAAGVPMPEVLAAETAATGDAPPFMILRRAPGVPAHQAVLTDAEREGVFEQLGRYAALIHAIVLPGFGSLAPAAGGYAGSTGSWGEYMIQDVAQSLAALPEAVLSRDEARAIRERLDRER